MDEIVKYLILLFAVVCLSCTGLPSSTQSPGQQQNLHSAKEDISVTKSDSEDKCTQNSDCVLVNANCCPCSSGGRMEAVHQSLVGSYNEKIKQKCTPLLPSLFCPEVYLCKKWKAECVDSACKILDVTE